MKPKTTYYVYKGSLTNAIRLCTGRDLILEMAGYKAVVVTTDRAVACKQLAALYKEQDVKQLRLF